MIVCKAEKWFYYKFYIILYHFIVYRFLHFGNRKDPDKFRISPFPCTNQMIQNFWNHFFDDIRWHCFDTRWPIAVLEAIFQESRDHRPHVMCRSHDVQVTLFLFTFEVRWHRPDFLKHDILLRRRQSLNFWLDFDNTKG